MVKSSETEKLLCSNMLPTNESMSFDGKQYRPIFKRHAYGVLFLVNAGSVAWRGSPGMKHYTCSYHHCTGATLCMF